MWSRFKPKYIEVSSGKLLTMFPRKLVEAGKIKTLDKVYRIPLDPAYVMKKVPSWKYSYIPERRDCEDFERIFRGWLSQKAWGNLLAFAVDLYFENKLDHAMIGFLDLKNKDEDGKNLILFGEPQTGIMVEIADYHIRNIRL